MLGNFERLFVFGLVSYVCVIGRLCNKRSESVLCGRFIIFIGADLNSVFQFICAVLGYECVDYLVAVAVVFGSLFIFCGAYSCLLYTSTATACISVRKPFAIVL